MKYINLLFNPIGNLVFAPFVALPPWLALTVMSAIGGIVGMWLYGLASNQAALKRVSDKTRANLLAMKIFKEELSVTFVSQGRLFLAVMQRLWLTVRPILIMSAPFVLAMSQMGARFEHRPFVPGESTIVTLELSRDAWGDHRNVDPTLSEGLTLETPALRDAKKSTVQWRVRVGEAGPHTIAWMIGDHKIEKQLATGDDLVVTSAKRPTSFGEQILYPSEVPFSTGSPVVSVAASMPKRSTPILGYDIHWLISFLLLSIVFGLMAKPFLKVQL
jgi:hypothetical protein